VPSDPADGATYVRAFLLPADTVSADLAGAHRAFSGVFQVSIVSPLNAGPGAALTLADSLAAQFPLNGRYTSGAITVQITTPVSIAPAVQDEHTYTVPAYFQYRADTI
jgi:hypothetical protein